MIMAASISEIPGRIFISYRREDAAYAAGWLYDRLVEHFWEAAKQRAKSAIRNSATRFPGARCVIVVPGMVR
jgi:hypothetical protein